MGQSAVATIFDPSTGAQVSSTAAAAASPLFAFPTTMPVGWTGSDNIGASENVVPLDCIRGNGISAVATISDPSTGAQVSSTAAAAASPLFGPYGQQQGRVGRGPRADGPVLASLVDELPTARPAFLCERRPPH
jgi:hypothetical protein